MAFWNLGGFHTASAVDRVLEKENHTLRDVLEAEDVIQEVLAPNAKLTEYLRQPNIISQLVDIVTELDDIKEHKSVVESEHHPDDGNNAKDEPSEMSLTATTLTANKEDTEHDQDDDEKAEPTKSTRPTSSFVGDNDNEKLGHSELDDIAEIEEVEEDEAAQSKPSQVADIENRSDTSDASDASVDASDDEEDEDEDELVLRKLAAEILSADVWSILDALITNKQAVDKLWTVLDTPEPEDLTGTALVRFKLRLSNFTKIIESLLEKRTDQTLDYMRGLSDLADMFMNHVDNPPLVDLLLKMISTDHPDNPTGILDVLYQQRLIPKMISRLSPDVHHSEQMAVGDFLKAFVTMSGPNNKGDNCSIGPNELSRQLVSDECITELIRLMLFGGPAMCIAVGVIIEIIRKNNSDYDMVQVVYTTLESHPPGLRDSIYLGGMLKHFANAIPEFQKMLTTRRPADMAMPFGNIEPLGFDRFRICELYAELLHCSNMVLLNDPRGEKISHARDIERERVHHGREDLVHENGSQGSETSESDNTDPRRLVVGSEPQDPPSPPAERVSDGVTSVSEVIPQSPPSPNDMQVDSPPKPETETDSLTGDALVQALEEQEKAVRNAPVVGDLLKLALDDSGCISMVFNMLFQFPWNNFLHNVVFDIVQQIFNGSMQDGYNKFLAIHLFSQDHITERIIQGQAENDQHEQERGTRLGYVGHLTLISEEVVKFAAVFPPETVSPVVSDALANPDWAHYVGQTLLKLREQYNTILGGHKTDLDEEHDDEDMVIGVSGDVERGNEETERMSQLELDDGNDQFTRYMSNQLSGMSGHFGSSDEEEDDDWENVDQSRQRSLGYHELDGSDDDDDDDDDDEDDGLSLMRSRSYNH